MIKQEQVFERRFGIRRRKIIHRMYCDKCGRIIGWAVPHPKGQFCEKCLQIVKQEESAANS